jgi:hypothetical protein
MSDDGVAAIGLLRKKGRFSARKIASASSVAMVLLLL